MKRTRDGRPGPFVDIEATVDDGEDEDEDGTDHGTSAEIQVYYLSYSCHCSQGISLKTSPPSKLHPIRPGGTLRTWMKTRMQQVWAIWLSR
jgi:hypothetical protein